MLWTGQWLMEGRGGIIPPYLVISSQEGAATLSEGHAVKAAEDVSREALAPFQARGLALCRGRQIRTRGWAGGCAGAVSAVGGALRRCEENTAGASEHPGPGEGQGLPCTHMQRQALSSLAQVP